MGGVHRTPEEQDPCTNLTRSALICFNAVGYVFFTNHLFYYVETYHVDICPRTINCSTGGKRGSERLRAVINITIYSSTTGIHYSTVRRCHNNKL